MTYRALDPASIVATCERLHSRIGERFPGSGLSKVSTELLSIARESTEHVDRIRRPNWTVRLLVGGGVLIILGAVAGFVLSFQAAETALSLTDVLQGLESAVNDVVFLGLAIFFLFTIERRLKQRDALRSLHELRSIAHVIDMHQLTKDPEQLLTPAMATVSSPERG